MPDATKPKTVAAYLAALPEDRRKVMKRLRTCIKRGLPKGFKEVISYGMPGWVVPHSLYPAGYHCDPSLPLPFMSMASQKGHVGVYHMGLYADPLLMAWFMDAWKQSTPAKLDMGKSCIRLKKLDAIPYELFETLATKWTPDDWIARYEAAFG
ncbi:MAG: DUF1801 domain-containing protein [Phycisphaerales bacterium]|jgi:hypothetical protein|nr:DUF1801 domain-containing protein [Phycisphaerales bacterium]